MRLGKSLGLAMGAAAVLSLAIFSGNYVIGADSSDKEVVNIPLPKPAYTGTPKKIPPGVNPEKPSEKPRDPFKAPKGTRLLSKGKPVTSSDKEPIIGSLEQITDGDKEGTDGSWVELGFGKQWVKIDLQKAAEIQAILVWHQHADPRVYKDVVVQLSNDPDFVTDVKEVYNNDSDNSSGLGIGKDREYFESYEGRLIVVPGVKARYMRLWSNGNTSDDQNHYTEVEVYGIEK